MSDFPKKPEDEDFTERFGRRMRRCTARSKRTGERCNQQAAAGFPVCRMHGANRKNRGAAKPGVMAGNLSALKHGAYARKMLTDEEKEVFDVLLAGIRQDFDLNESTDQAQASMAAFYYAKWHCAVLGNAEAAVGSYDVLFRKQIECLKATRAQRDTSAGPQTTPAEWAVALLASVRQGGKPKAMSPAEPAPED